MKKRALFTLLPLSAIALTGCFSFYNQIDQEKFLEYIDTVEEAINIDNPTLENVKIGKKLGADDYNYKEGEFFHHSWWVGWLIVPIVKTEATWKENGQYFYYCYDPWNEKNRVDKEITEEEFETRMSSHKNEVINRLTEVLNKTKSFFDSESETTYQTTTYKDNYNSYKVVAEYEAPDYSTADEDDFIKGKHTVVFSKSLPAKWDFKDGDSSNYYRYSYGKAKFSNPHDNKDE